MAALDPAAPVSVTQVASHFVQQYYHIIQEQPHHSFRFYKDLSSMEIVDGVTTKSASSIELIHNLILSLEFSAIEIKTINSAQSWNGGVFVVVSGSVQSKDFSGTRKFVQSFFLAPQEGGYFVLNDVFHLLDEEVVNQTFVPEVSEVASEPPMPVIAEDEIIAQPVASNLPQDTTPGTLQEMIAEFRVTSLIPVHAVEEEEGRAYLDSDHTIGDHIVEDYSFQVHQKDHNSVHETVEENTLEEPSENFQNAEDLVQETLASEEKPVGEDSKPSYASILRAARGQPKQTVRVVQPVMAPHQPVQQSNPVPNVTDEVAEESLSHREGHSKSIYVRNLPSSVSTLELLEEFKTFGRVKQDGVYLVNNKGVGACFAFVEFEDVQSAQNAIKASPLKIGGRQIYIETRKSNSYSGSRGGRTMRGRGRGGRLGGRDGRRGHQEGNDTNRMGINGFGDM